jgi:predicted PurR-regulated permease PerM
MWARGQLILMGAIGVSTGIAYTILGLPAALLLAVIAALAEIIPIVGPLIGAIPALLLATTVSLETAILTLGVYVLLQLIEGNILVPIVMRNTVGLSPFLVLGSLLVGAAVAGIPGAIVAVPLVAAVEVILERFQAREVPVPIEPSQERQPDEAERQELAKVSPDSPATVKPKRASARGATRSRTRRPRAA